MTTTELRPACVDCGRRWRHCHATFVLHADGSGSCSEPGCGVAAFEPAHALVVDCGSTGCRCGG